MTVSQMRRLLAAVRARLARQNEFAPFSLVEEIAPGVVAWELCTRVAVGLHEKRTRSRTREKRGGSERGAPPREKQTQKQKEGSDGEEEEECESETGGGAAK